MMANSILQSDTRLESWIKVQPDLGARQNQVLGVIRRLGKAAGFQVADLLELPTYVVLPRITELVAAGLLEDTGERAWNETTKRRVIIWRASELGK